MKDQQKDVGKCNQSLENRRENLKDHWKVGPLESGRPKQSIQGTPQQPKRFEQTKNTTVKSGPGPKSALTLVSKKTISGTENRNHERDQEINFF